MSYDFHGTWDSHTGFHCALYADYATTDLYSNANAAVTYLLTHGVSSRKVMLGIPFYGRGWTGVNRTNDGLYQKAAAAASGTYEAGIDDYKVIKLKNGTVFMNAPANATWKFDNTTGTFWTYDSPATIDLKVAYSKTKNLRGLFSWSIDGDTTDGELLGHMGGFL